MASKYSEAQKRQIMSDARENLAWRPPPRDEALSLVQKSYTPPQQRQSNAEVATASTSATTATSQRWADWVTGEIEERIDTALEKHTRFLMEVLGESLGEERVNYDAKLKELEHAITLTRTEAAIERKMHRLHSRVEAAIRRQPNFENELTALREELAKTQKQLVRARSNICELEYSLRQMGQQQTKAKVEITRTDVRVETIGAATREAMSQIEGIASILDHLEPLGHG